ncbi:WD40 repeat domain-containing protein [bacterium]|nr:WD40 repeat domain-containing protein [bacterium]
MKLMHIFTIVAIIAIALFNLNGCGDNSTAPPGNGNNYESPPLPPEDLSALPLSRSEIQLTWKDRSDNEEGFHIFESINNDSSYQQIAIVGADKITHKLDGKRVDSLDYYYKLRSYNKFGNSAFTNEALVSGSALAGEVDVGESPVTCIDYDPSGRYILVGCGDYKVKRYYSTGLEVAQTLEMHRSLIKSVAYSPDSLRFASGDNDGIIRVWNVALGRVEYVFTTNSAGGGKADKLEFSSNSRYLAAGSEYVNIWELETGELYDRLSIDDSMEVDCYAWHPEGRYIVIAGNYKIQIWEIGDNNEPTCSFDLPISTALEPSYLAVSPDGKYIIGAKSSIIIWEIKDQGGSISIEHVLIIGEDDGGHQGSVYGIDFSYNGLYFATCSNDNTIKVWDTNSFENVATIDAHEPAVYGVAFSPDGMHMASGGGDTKIKVWLTFF